MTEIPREATANFRNIPAVDPASWFDLVGFSRIWFDSLGFGLIRPVLAGRP